MSTDPALFCCSATGNVRIAAETAAMLLLRHNPPERSLPHVARFLNALKVPCTIQSVFSCLNRPLEQLSAYDRECVDKVWRDLRACEFTVTLLNMNGSPWKNVLFIPIRNLLRFSTLFFEFSAIAAPEEENAEISYAPLPHLVKEVGDNIDSAVSTLYPVMEQAGFQSIGRCRV